GASKLPIVSANGRTTYGRTAPTLVFRPAADTNVSLNILTPRSVTPAEAVVAADLADYLIVVKAPPDPPPNVIRVGGLPGRRVYFRFNIPSRILDSSNVVRATLQLTQRPNPLASGPRDSVALAQLTVTAGAALTAPAR